MGKKSLQQSRRIRKQKGSSSSSLRSESTSETPESIADVVQEISGGECFDDMAGEASGQLEVSGAKLGNISSIVGEETNSSSEMSASFSLGMEKEFQMTDDSSFAVNLDNFRIDGAVQAVESLMEELLADISIERRAGAESKLATTMKVFKNAFNGVLNEAILINGELVNSRGKQIT